MSRGLGKLQRDVLGVLDEPDYECDYRQLAEELYDTPDVSRSQMTSLRRAVSGLLRRGYVSVTPHPYDGRLRLIAARFSGEAFPPPEHVARRRALQRKRHAEHEAQLVAQLDAELLELQGSQRHEAMKQASLDDFLTRLSRVRP